MSQNTIIIIAGPTAVGKTALAIQVAQHFHTEIISADSRQCYREMKIGVARPSEAELATVPHHFVASHRIQDKVTAATFEQYALQKADEIFTNNPVAVMVGGTGLYINAFEKGLDPIPDIPQTIRTQIAEGYNKNGLAWLQQQVQTQDPFYYTVGETQNPHRLMRALEVVQATGQSILSFRKGTGAQRPFQTIKVALQLPKEQLHQNISHRVDQMVAEGLESEAEGLAPHQHLPALQTVGYKEWFAYFKGEISKDAAIESIKIHTKQYAKRQRTWFKKDASYHWFEPNDPQAVIAFVSEKRSRV